MNLNHRYALSEIIFIIVWVQINNLVLDKIAKSVFIEHFKMRTRQCPQLNE